MLRNAKPSLIWSLQQRTLAGIAMGIAVLIPSQGPNARMADSAKSIQPIDALRGGTQGESGSHSTGSKGGPSVMIASLNPLGEKHAVVLSWKASVPASSAPADAIKGYIVQRSMKSKDHSALPIHTGVVPGTSCTDDLVENDKTYFYVVRAVAQNGRTSEPSNEAKAVIPKDAGPVPASKGPYLLCREAGKAH